MTPATKIEPRSVSTPTDAPFRPWTWILAWSPGRCELLATIEASAPLANRTTATAVSSTSISGWLRFAVQPSTSATGPRNQRSEVELVDRLVDEHAAALAGLRPAPGIHRVVLGSAPAEHLDRGEPGLADPPAVDRVLDPADRRVPAPLADDRQHDPDASRRPRSSRRQSAAVRAIGFSTTTWRPGPSRRDRLLGVERVRRADDDGVDAAALDHRLEAGVDAGAVRSASASGRSRVPARRPRPAGRRGSAPGRRRGARRPCPARRSRTGRVHRRSAARTTLTASSSPAPSWRNSRWPSSSGATRSISGRTSIEPAARASAACSNSSREAVGAADASARAVTSSCIGSSTVGAELPIHVTCPPGRATASDWATVAPIPTASKTASAPRPSVAAQDQLGPDRCDVDVDRQVRAERAGDRRAGARSRR